jgi:hypothetical protein
MKIYLRWYPFSQFHSHAILQWPSGYWGFTTGHCIQSSQPSFKILFLSSSCPYRWEDQSPSLCLGEVPMWGSYSSTGTASWMLDSWAKTMHSHPHGDPCAVDSKGGSAFLPKSSSVPAEQSRKENPGTTTSPCVMWCSYQAELLLLCYHHSHTCQCPQQPVGSLGTSLSLGQQHWVHCWQESTCSI